MLLLLGMFVHLLLTRLCLSRKVDRAEWDALFWEKSTRTFSTGAQWTKHRVRLVFTVTEIRTQIEAVIFNSEGKEVIHLEVSTRGNRGILTDFAVRWEGRLLWDTFLPSVGNLSMFLDRVAKRKTKTREQTPEEKDRADEILDSSLFLSPRPPVSFPMIRSILGESPSRIHCRSSLSLARRDTNPHPPANFSVRQSTSILCSSVLVDWWRRFSRMRSLELIETERDVSSCSWSNSKERWIRRRTSEVPGSFSRPMINLNDINERSAENEIRETYLIEGDVFFRTFVANWCVTPTMSCSLTSMIWSPTWMLQRRRIFLTEQEELLPSIFGDHTLWIDCFDEYAELFQATIRSDTHSQDTRTNVKRRVLCLRSRTSFPALPNLEKNDWLRSTIAFSPTFFDLHLENIHFLDALFQFVFCRGRKRIDVFIASIVFTGRVRQINLWFTSVAETKRALLPSYSDRCRAEFHSSVIIDGVFLEFRYAWLLEEQWRWQSTIKQHLIEF